MFSAMALSLMVLTDPPALLTHISLIEATFVWTAAATFHIVSFFLVATAVAYARSVGWIKWMFMPLIGMISIAPGVASAEFLIKAISGPEYQVVMLRKIATYYLILQIFEFGFVRLILPRGPQPVMAFSQRQAMRVGDALYPVDKLRYLEAREHYVRIALDTEDILQRVRLGDLVAQFSPEDGCQPHRSWWVSKRATPRLTRQGAGKAALVLSDGTEVPVARGRLQEVQDWLVTEGQFNDSPEAAAVG